MISQGGSGGVDLVAVARDAELLDQLAARAAILDDDAVSAMLAAFAAEVDDGLVALLDEVEPADRRPVARPADRALVALPVVLAEPRPCVPRCVEPIRVVGAGERHAPGKRREQREGYGRPAIGHWVILRETSSPVVVIASSSSAALAE